jgi:hypothetical protein
VGAQPRETLVTTSINQTEIPYGITMLRTGRRIALAAAAQAMFAEDLAPRVLPYDSLAAARYAEIVAARRRAGSPMEAFDELIVATALNSGRGSRHAMLAGSPWVTP